MSSPSILQLRIQSVRQSVSHQVKGKGTQDDEHARKGQKVR